MGDKVLGFLGILFKANKALIGETARASKKGKLALLATDASENSKKEAYLLSEKWGYEILECYSKEVLGNALGYESVGFVIITDPKAAKAIIAKRKEQIDEENTISL